MTALPEPPAAPAAGQAANPLTDSVISAAVNDALHKTFHRDDTPVPLIERLRPDIWVKGADYAKEEVVGAAFVEANSRAIAKTSTTERSRTATSTTCQIPG